MNPDIHQQLCDLLDREGAVYRVIEHAAEGRTELVAKIRGNRIEQSIKSMTLQVRIIKRKISIALRISLVTAVWILPGSKVISMRIASRLLPKKKHRR